MMGAATDLATYDVTSEDIEYQRIDGETLLARLYRPRGTGPFPAVVGVHGGAWTSGDRTNNVAIDQALAAAGTVVMALDFRIAPRWRYPASVADVNFGIRWLKAHAAQFDTRADWVGSVGSSSGAQQMLLNALRPRDPRYRAAGGKVVLETFEGEPHTFVTKDPSSPASLRAIELMRRFVGRRGQG